MYMKENAGNVGAFADLIDKQQELIRLGKEIEKTEKEMTRLKNKLQNDKFIANAPAHIIDKEKQKQLRAESALLELNEQRNKMENL